MRRIMLLFSVIFALCFAAFSEPAAAETFDDYAALAEAFNAATEDTTPHTGG